MRSVPWATVVDRASARLASAGRDAVPVEETRFTRYVADETVPVEERLVLAVWLAAYRRSFGHEAAGQGRPGWRPVRRVLAAPDATCAVECGDQLVLFAPTVPEQRAPRRRGTGPVAAAVAVVPQLALF